MEWGALRDYCRKQISPRGLRMKKQPEMFPCDDTFKDRWFVILNKSLDLMALLIETAVVESSKLEQEIQQLEDKIQGDWVHGENILLDKETGKPLLQLKEQKF